MNNYPPLHRKESIGPHLSQDQLFQLLAGQVAPTEKREMEAHLQQCTFCTEALEGFTHSDQSAAQATLLELNHLVKKRTTRRKPNTLITDIKTWGVATVIIFLILISAAIVWNAVQTTPTIADKKPENATNPRLALKAQPIKGYSHLQAYVKEQQSKIPATTKTPKGAVVLSFTVNPDSTLSNFKVVKSLSKNTDQAAINIIKNGPAWQHARRQGKVIAQEITLPVKFN